MDKRVCISAVFLAVFTIVALLSGPVRAEPPLANSGEDRNATSGLEVVLDGTRSYSPAGIPIVKYLWHFKNQNEKHPLLLKGNGTSTPSFIPNITISKFYNFTLTVVDKNGVDSAIPDLVTIHVLPGPKCNSTKISAFC